MYKYLLRKTSSVTFIPEIDGLRFFAIITVVIFHMNTALSDALRFDWKSYFGVSLPSSFGWWILRLDLGVKVFFAISGFILSLPFLKHYLQDSKKVNLGSYFYRRLLRLEPPFLISLLILFVAQIVLLQVNWKLYIGHFFASIFYIHGFIYGTNSPVNPVTWSLETEAQFYIFLPIFLSLIFLNKKRIFPLILLLLLFVLGLFFRKFIFQNSLNHLGTSLLVYLTNFCTGIFFAYLYILNPLFIKRKHLVYDLIGLGAIVGLFYFYKPQILILNNLLFNFFIFLFFVSVFKGGLLNYFFTRKVIYIIGGMCYTIYLIHYALFYILAQKLSYLFVGYTYYVQLILFASMSIIILAILSMLFYILIERPCMDKNWPSQLKAYLTRSKL